MADLSNPTDPPPGWQRDHLHEYVASGGREGHLWNGVPTLLLTTAGRRSGQARRTPLIYGRDGDSFVVVASAGGAPGHPAWYHNLAADPAVRVQVLGEEFPARARTATADERPKLWSLMTGIWPDYDEYQTRTTREIPLVVLERVAGA
jgi:deazaflavin-dependent oxidoreductase (nitroreductase family)